MVRFTLAILLLAAGASGQRLAAESRVEVYDVADLVSPPLRALVPRAGVGAGPGEVAPGSGIEPGEELAPFALDSLEELLQYTIDPAGWDDEVGHVVEPLGHALVVRSADPLLHQEVAELLRGLQAPPEVVRARLALRPGAGLPPTGQVELLVVPGQEFRAYVGELQAIRADEDVELTTDGPRLDSVVDQVATGLWVLGRADGTEKEPSLRDLRVWSVRLRELRERFAGRGLQLPDLRECVWRGEIEGLGAESQVVELPGAAGGLLDVHVEPPEPVGERAAPPTGVPFPRVRRATMDLLVADLRSLQPEDPPVVPRDSILLTGRRGEGELLVMEDEPFLLEDVFTDLIMTMVSPPSWDEDGALLEVHGGLLHARNRPLTLAQLDDFLEELVAQLPSSFRLVVSLAAAPVGEPLEIVHQGDLLLRSGQVGTSSDLRRRFIVQHQEAVSPAHSAWQDPVVVPVLAGSRIVVQPRVLAGTSGLRVAVWLECQEPLDWPLPQQEEARLVELPRTRAAVCSTMAHLWWNQPTVVAELTSPTHRYQLTLTAHTP